MFDLKSILKDIKVEEKAERKRALIGIVEENIVWSGADKLEPIIHLSLTKYQLYWLMWRVRVHLKSYEHFEWSEMKDVLEVILAKLEEEWTKCQSTVALDVEESTSNGPALTNSQILSTVDFV